MIMSTTEMHLNRWICDQIHIISHRYNSKLQNNVVTKLNTCTMYTVHPIGGTDLPGEHMTYICKYIVDKFRVDLMIKLNYSQYD